jgi:alpha-D-xyloside xylohydrolase
MTEAGNKNIINLVRCAWAGSQKYGSLVWSGDIESSFKTLNNQLRIGLNMGIAGIPWWTTDIGGVSGANTNDPEFHELITRWFEFATFCPVMRMHGDRDPHAKPLETDGGGKMPTGAPTEPWTYGTKIYKIMKKYINLRYDMHDYIKSLMQEAHEDGTPIMRPLFYDFDADKDAWNVDSEYMFGPDVLVAPITSEGQKDRDVYLPFGENWINIYDGSTCSGGQTINTNAPIDVIPLFTRENHPLKKLIDFGKNFNSVNS